MMKKIMILILAVVIIAGCAPGPNQFTGYSGDEVKIAGFWKGLWHGIIAPIVFIISLFKDNMNIYEVNNNGNWYNFGFLIGMTIIFGGGGGGAGRKKWCR
jgi:hypothetical protein